MNLLYVHITRLPNNVSLYALLNMSENGHLVTKLQNRRHERILCERYGMKKWSPLTFGIYTSFTISTCYQHAWRSYLLGYGVYPSRKLPPLWKKFGILTVFPLKGQSVSIRLQGVTFTESNNHVISTSSHNDFLYKREMRVLIVLLFSCHLTSFIFILWICTGLQSPYGYGNSHVCIKIKEVKSI